MDGWMGWAVAVFFIVMGFYMGATKPECRDGFTPLIGAGSGWYCAPGYKPK